ncbi:Secreted protein OS=Streptomyces tendae OX=1932 GN=GUR47_21845 PE=4 SV=1 [Streptomyces tendae]
MRPAPHAVTAGRASGACLRALVLLLVLVVPCAPVAERAVPVAAVAGAGGAAGEYDHLDTALRAPARGVRRAAVVRPLPPSFGTGRRFLPRLDAPAERAAALPRGPRSVVLRC